MKKIFLSSLMMLCAVCLFTACSDDNDSNPTLVQPSTFVLNEPTINGASLAMSNSIPFTWSQPDYGGWPAAVEYQLEVSMTNTWNISTDKAAEDESGETIADYATLATVYTTAKGSMDAQELDKALVKLGGWTEDIVPESQTVYVRCKATTAGAQDVYSNVVTMDVKPYYIELADAPIELWYLVGAEIGSKAWDNSAGSVGIGLIPMYPVYGNDYDAATGCGELEYVGYFHAGQGFKLIKTPGSWDEQWGMSDGAFVMNDGGSGNIDVSEDGFYKITLNTASNVLKMDHYTPASSNIYAAISMPGAYQDWNVEDNFMEDFSTSVENHDWYLLNVTYSDTELKFAANMSWDVNWGDVAFPYGIGVQNGSNIVVKAGTYNVFFNDITGYYNFIEVK